jgi:hypothetical protein
MSSAFKKHERFLQAGPDLTIANYISLPNPVETSNRIRFELELLASSNVRVNEASILLHSVERTRVGIVDLRPAGLPLTMTSGECLRIEADLRSIPLVENQYLVSLWIDSSSFVGEVTDLPALRVSPQGSNSLYVPYRPEVRGLVEFESAIRTTRAQRNNTSLNQGVPA